MQARIVTITVDKGLNMAENKGPLLDIHHACVKNEIADPTACKQHIYPHIYIYIYISNLRNC